MTPTYPNSGYEVFNTIQASGADLDLDAGVLTLGNPLQKVCNFKDIIIPSTSIVVAVAEQLQETTLTPTAGDNQTYQFFIQQWNPVTRKNMELNVSITTAASGATATTISTSIKNAVNAATANGQLKIDATGTTTAVLTALTGYAVFTVSIIQVGAGLTQATGTAGIAAVGTAAMLALQGITTGITTGASYTQITIDYQNKTGADVKSPVGPVSSLLILLDEAATNYAALLAKFQYILAGRATSIGGPANPEAVAVV